MILSIIIVNYRSAQLILDCLHTLYAGSADRPYEVLVVDNASGDDSLQRIKDAFPMVKCIDMGYNSGFARANNEGIRQSTGDAVLLLNGDTLPEAAAVTECFHRLMASPDHVAAGVQLLNTDGSPQIAGMYVMKGGLNYLLPLPYLGSLVKKTGELASVKKPHVPDAAGTVDVDWINGAFLMVKKNAIGKAGLLDEDFFLYAEEAEWCSRLKKQGLLCIYGDLRVIHLQGETANQTFDSKGKGYFGLFDRKGKQIMLSNFVRIRKQFGVGWFLVQLLFYVADIPVFAIGALFSRIIRGRSARYSGRQLRQFTGNVGTILRLTPAIIRNKPYFYKVL
jgi:GT2 family glycosyltransferase